RVEELERQLQEKESQILALREEIYPLQLQGKEFHRSEIEQQIRQLQNDGELMQLLDTLIAKKRQGQDNYTDALTYIARLYMHKKSSTRNYIYEKILAALDTEEMPEFMMR